MLGKAMAEKIADIVTGCGDGCTRDALVFNMKEDTDDAEDP